MKNHWLESRNNKKTRIIFELFSILPAMEVNLDDNTNKSGIWVSSDNPNFVTFVNSANRLFGPKGYMTIISENNILESFVFDDVKELGYLVFPNLKTNKSKGFFRFTCSNMSQIKSKFLKVS